MESRSECVFCGAVQSNPGLHRLLLGMIGMPIGLILTLLCGAELFNGNTLILTVAVIPPLSLAHRHPDITLLHECRMFRSSYALLKAF